MDVSLFDMAVQAIFIIMEPERLGFLALGVVFGLALGVVPGLSGIVGLALLLPYTWDMDPFSALAFLMGLASVVTTADTIPTVLFGVPGTVGSAATIMDGFPMAKKGEAGRAFGAAFSASVMGGLVGALVLAASIPVMRPIILSLGTPDQLAFCIFGLSIAAILSGGSPLKGLAGVCIGLMVATAGDDPQTGTLRWTFNFLYLWDGLHIVPMALGLFALPEIADLVIRRQSIDAGAVNRDDIRRSQFDGMRDVRRSWWLVLRCGSIGAALGAVPGIGASVIDWVAYGHAARTEKGASETFGLGDVRGVIASEASNNAKEGGALIPTIAFGVPGSASMALLLGAFLIHGLVPGPDMLSKHLDITFTLIWSVALANLLGAGLCFVFAGQLARIAMVRIGVLAPVVLAFVFVGAFQGSRAWGDIVAVLVFGLLGWAMKRVRWPRPPLMLGFVLGEVVEQYMFISFQLYEWDWLMRPVVIIMLLIALYGIVRPIMRDRAARKRAGQVAKRTFGFRRENLNGEFLFNAVLFVIFVNTLIISSQWDVGARLVPQIVGVFGTAFVGLRIALDLFFLPAEPEQPTGAAGVGGFHFDNVMDFGDLAPAEIRRRGAVYFAWCIGFFLVGLVIGLLPAMLVFLIGYLRFQSKESWIVTLGVSLPLWGFCYILFHKMLHIAWPQSFIG
ncbi:MAG: tripartite tricarboxylate transporter permease, partial [Rhodospirillaceae bacterium]|nr:tripartite tricarboxylate transporter permease [Rhodospirillaceae bacterium]